MKIVQRIVLYAVLAVPMAIFSGFAAGGKSQAQTDGEAGLIKVAVRVYDGSRFVGSLNPDDFEILENGAPRKIESLSLLRKNGPAAAGSRIFVLCFEMDEVPPRTEEAIDYFFENVPDENDIVLVQTPRDRWKFIMGAKEPALRGLIAAELKPRLVESVRRGGQTVRQRLITLRDMAAFDGDEFMIRWRARDIIDRMTAEQSIDETQYLAFADYFKALPGQKHLFIFYREEAFPIPPLFLDDWQRMVAVRQSAFDKKRIRTFFADSGLTFHFLFLQKEKRAKVDVELREDGAAMKGDFFQAFSELAVTTGGIVATNTDPFMAMKQASEAAGNYYLLTFRPEAAPRDASFKEITVKVKAGGYKVFHRAGYIEK